MSKNYKTKKIFKSIALVLVGVILCAGFLHFSGTDIKVDWLTPERNDKNLIKLDDGYLKSGTENKGVKWEVSEDGTIKLYGEAVTASSIVVQNVELGEGKYTYSVGTDKVNKDKFYSYAMVNGHEYIAGTDDDTFEIVEPTTVQIVICWFEKADFGNVLGTTFRPVLVEGDNPGSFYAK